MMGTYLWGTFFFSFLLYLVILCVCYKCFENRNPFRAVCMPDSRLSSLLIKIWQSLVVWLASAQNFQEVLKNRLFLMPCKSASLHLNTHTHTHKSFYTHFCIHHCIQRCSQKFSEDSEIVLKSLKGNSPSRKSSQVSIYIKGQNKLLKLVST